MQIFPHQLVNLPVLSLQTGGQIAITTGLLINPESLTLSAFTCLGLGRAHCLLLPQDIKQAGAQGLIVDSDEALAEPTDIVRLQPLLEKPFRLEGLPVVTQLGRKVGKVETYTISPDDYEIQKLYIHRPIMQSFVGGSLIVDRGQIADVTNTQIVVKDTEILATELAAGHLAKTGKLHT